NVSARQPPCSPASSSKSPPLPLPSRGPCSSLISPSRWLSTQTFCAKKPAVGSRIFGFACKPGESAGSAHAAPAAVEESRRADVIPLNHVRCRDLLGGLLHEYQLAA